MNIQLRISEQYKGDKLLKELIDNLPDSFTSASEVLWNGRNKIKAFKIEDGKEAVVKKFKPLNLIQKLSSAFRLHKAEKAYINGLELIKRGFHTPFPIAYVEIRNWRFIKDAYYICERNDMPPIEDLLYRDDWDKDLALAFAHFAVQLHQKGILHHDLNDTNVRFAKRNNEYEFSLIDINRMSFYNSIDDIPMKERIENLTRFTGNIDLFECVAREYAKSCGLPIAEWTKKAVEQKKRHDRNWYRRKRILHPFRKI